MKKERLDEVVAVTIQRSRIDRGLPPTIEDDSTLRKIAEIFRNAEARKAQHSAA